MNKILITILLLLVLLIGGCYNNQISQEEINQVVEEVEEIEQNINKNHLKMKYYFKLLLWKFTITVLINDHMFLINNKEIVNTTYVSKFGIKLAKVVLLYKKKS